MLAWSCRVIRAVVLLLAVPLAACTPSLNGCSWQGNCTESRDMTIFAAASLFPAFTNIGSQFQADEVRAHGHVVTRLRFIGSGTQMLTAQIQQGAHADVFASADTAHMATLENAGMLGRPARTFAHNKLEIAVAKGNPKHVQTLADLSRAGLVVVLADPSVPAGKYAQQALSKAHVTVRPASLELQVTSVLSKIALGEADAGIVYVSDVTSNAKVSGVTIPDEQNVIADYPIATLKSATNTTAAQAFVDLVLSPDGQAILKAAGFQGA
jgi:molybdate transport system substrate-binding protein